MGKFIDPYGNRKFYTGKGRTRDRNLNDRQDNYQDVVLNHLESKVPTTLQNDYSDPEFEKQLKEFYSSKQWKDIRKTAYESLTHCCPVCWAETDLVVDHIKPVRHFWDERLNPDNLQLLCRSCNEEKGSMLNWNIDWHLNLHKKKKRMTERYKSLYLVEDRPKPVAPVQTTIQAKPFRNVIRVVKKDGTVVERERNG